MFGDYLSSISEGRGILGNVGMGFRDVGEGVVGGIGRGAQMLGAEGLGGALVSAGEFIGPSAADDARDAMIREQQGLGGQILTAVQRSVPSMALAIAGGVGGGALAAGGLRAAAAGGAAARAGQLGGVSATIFPMEIQSSYEAAQQGGYDVQDPEVQADIWATAATKTIAQTLPEAFLAGAFSRAFGTALRDASKRTLRNTALPILGAGSAEGAAETFATLADRVMFDPELRAEFNERDWAALAPLIVSKYGEEGLVAAGAGFLLGGGFRAAIMPFEGGRAPAAGETPPGETPAPQRDLTGSEPTDVLGGGTVQPPLGLPAPEAPLALPAPRVGLMGPSTVITPPPAVDTGPIITPPPGAMPMLGMPEGLEGPVAQGFQRAAAAGPAYRLPRSPAPLIGLPAPDRSAAAAPEVIVPPAPPGSVPPVAPPPPPPRAPITPQSLGLEGPVAEGFGIAALRRAAGLPTTGESKVATVPTPPEGVFVGAKGQPFKNKAAAQLQRKRVASRENVPADRLEPIEVTGGWGLQVTPEPEPEPTPPTPSRGPAPKKGELTDAAKAKRERQKRAADKVKGETGAVEEPSPETGTVREGPKAGSGDGEQDTQGQAATREGAAQTEGETQAEGAAQEPTPARQAEVAPRRGLSDAALRRLKAAEAAAIKLERERAPVQRSQEERAAAERVALQERVDALSDDQRLELQDQITTAGRGRLKVLGAADYTDIDTLVATDPRAAARLVGAVEVGTRARAEDAGRREAEAVPAVTPPVSTELEVISDPAEGMWVDTLRGVDAFTAETVPAYADLDPEVRARWEQAVAKGDYFKAKKGLTAQEKTLLDLADRHNRKVNPELFVEDDVDATVKDELIQSIEIAEDKLDNPARRFRRLLDQTELDAGLELLTLSENKDPEVAEMAARALAGLGKFSQQVPQITEYRARVDAHRALGGNTRDADFATKELQNMVDAWNGGFVPENSIAVFGVRFKELAMRARKATGEDAEKVLQYVTAQNTPKTRGGRFSLASLTNAVLASGKRATPLPAGKQRMIARNFLSKFKIKPKLSVFKDQADLRQRNPELYGRAVAARTQGDFDTAPAAGYFFDGEVIIFSDRIATRQQLEFVVAHETIGHYGLRAVASNADFSALMDSVYTSSSPDMKQAIDNSVAARGMSRVEATEEYLSDFAAHIEMSILRKWWAKAKSWLNAVGFKFDDDVARYMMNQSRRYLRTGQAGTMFDVDRVAASLTQLDAGTDPTGTGRFSTSSATGTIRSMGHVVDNPSSPIPESVFDAQDRIASAAKTLGLNMKDLGNTYDKVKQNLVTPTVFRMMRSEGGKIVYNLLLKRTNIARSIVTQMQTLRSAALQPRVEALATLGFSSKAISVGGREKVGYVLKANRMVQTFNFRAPSTKNLPRLFLRDAATGKLQPVEKTFEDLLKQNRLSRAEWARGVQVPYETPRTMTDAKRAELTAARDAELAKATTDKAKDTITKKYAARIGSNTYTEVDYLDVQQTFTDVEWEAFNQELDSISYTARAVLEAKLTKYDEEVSTTYRRLQKAMAAAMTDSDRALMDRAVRRFVEIQDANLGTFDNGTIDPSTRDVESAEKFLIQFNSALLGKGRDRIYDLFKPNDKNNGIVAFPEAEKQTIIDMIDGLRTRYTPPEDTPGSPSSVREARMAVQREVRFIADQLSGTLDAEKAAIRTILTGYVPIVREGEFSAGVEFRNKDGKKFQLMEAYREQAPYMQFARESEALTAAERITELFAGQTHTVEVWDAAADGGKGKAVLMEGTLTGTSGAVVNAASTDPELSHDAAMRFIRRFNIPLTPQKLEQIVIASTSAGNNAILRQLKTGFTPGAPNDLTSAISQHIESRASTIARDKTSVALASAMDFSGEASSLWLGDQAKYDRLKAEYERLKAEPNPNEDAISIARQEFEEYHYQFVAEDAPNKGAAKYNEARKVVDFLDQQKGVLETDLANNKHIAAVQMLTSISYLGMMVASAGLNVSSLATNVPAALGTVNHKTGFGGGFGITQASTTLTKMLKVAGFGGQNDTAEFWAELSKDSTRLKEKGISKETAEFIAEGIDSGIFQAAQTNALMGSARGRITSGGAQEFLRKFMGPFNLTEQLSRRAAGLAAFELEFQRQLRAGKSREAAAEAAAKFGQDLVIKTLGDYTSQGRPALFRGGPLQFAFMFKMFTVNTAALIANLPPKGQVLMLGSLLLLSGLRGIPYAEDIEDLVNTLAQKFGIPMPSVRDAIRRTGDGLLPGFGETLVSGALNKLVPYDIGTRFSAGDIVPGTGMFLAGADVTRELLQIGGPMASWTQQAVGTIGSLTDAIVPGGRAPSIVSILRESPVTFARAVGDAIAYEQYGAIVDKRGYTVSNDYNSAIAVGRVLGLYPGVASRNYESVRESKLIVEYQKGMTVYFRDRIVAAQVQRDSARVAELYAEVREWNQHAKGTGLEVVNIRDRVSKALRAQRLSASERFIKTTPLSSRDAAQRIVDVYVAN
jgi:hypothetical protein